VGVKNARYFVEDWGADFLIGIDSSAVALAVGEIMPSLKPRADRQPMARPRSSTRIWCSSGTCASASASASPSTQDGSPPRWREGSSCKALGHHLARLRDGHTSWKISERT